MKKNAKKINKRILIISLAILFSAIGLFIFNQKNKLYRKSQLLMGTYIEVVSPYPQAPYIVFSEISRIERLLSKYRPDSEIFKLNEQGKVVASLDTMYVLRKSKEFWIITDGALDITVGPLLDLWGFTQKKYYLPTQAQINAVLPRVGYDKIILNDENNLVELKVFGMKVDLGAVAKGFAVDCAVRELKERGIKSCLINTGGQIYCLGDRFGKPWVIAIQNPREHDILESMEVKDQAVSTSGDYEQFFMVGNKRYSHIFNPKTGYPADSGIVSVTVIAKDNFTADALSTAIFVLGKEKGLKLIEHFPGVKTKIIEEKDVKDFE